MADPPDQVTHYPNKRWAQGTATGRTLYLCGKEEIAAPTSWTDGTNWTWMPAQVTCIGCAAKLAQQALEAADRG